MQEASLLGVLHLDPAVTRRMPAIEQALAAILDEPLPNAPRGQDAAHRLAFLFAHGHGQIQRQSRIPVGEQFAVRRGRAGAGPVVDYTVALPAPHPQAAKVALEWIIALFDRPRPDGQREAIHEQLHPMAHPSLNLFNIHMAARRAGIPVQNLTREVVILGTGRRSRWMDSTLTDATPAIGVHLAGSKMATSRLLRAGGLPGGIHAVAASADEAVSLAQQFDSPVVVKPADQQRGIGVSADLRHPADIAAAHAEAARHSSTVLVEKWQPGCTHRLTVFNGRVIRVNRRIAGGVVGDGSSDIQTLVCALQQSEAQQRARRRLGKTLVELDEEALGLLRQYGLAPDHVPAAGEYVRLRRRDNINAGGSNEALDLERVHPDNLRLAVDAAALLRLDFAGVDLITEDIGRSWLDIGALICEVNAQPQMGARSEPEIYETVLRELVGGEPRIPAHLRIVPSADAARRAALDRALREPLADGISIAQGLWIAGHKATAAFTDDFRAALGLLRRTDVSHALCMMSVRDVHRDGLPLDRWDSIELPADSDLDPEEAKLLPIVRTMVEPHCAASSLPER